MANNILKEWFKEFVHNVIIHPLMMVLPLKIANEMHDRNADWAFGSDRMNELKLESAEDPPIDHDVFNKYLLEALRYHISEMEGGTTDSNLLEFYNSENPEEYNVTKYKLFENETNEEILLRAYSMAGGFYHIGKVYE